MASTLRNSFGAGPALESTFATPEENAVARAQAEQQQMEDMGALRRNANLGTYNLTSMLQAGAGQVVEPFSQQAAQPFFDESNSLRREGQRYVLPTDVQSWDQVHDPVDALRFVGNMGAQNIPNAIPSATGAAAARFGLRNVAMNPFLKTLAGTTAGAFPMQFGEGVQTLRDDPVIMAGTTPAQRLGAAAGYGLLTAPMEGAEEALALTRLGGGGAATKNIFKDGFKTAAKSAAGHVAMAVPEAAVTEGVPEALQQLSQQGMQSAFNPERDKSRDAHDLKEAFFGGWAGGLGMSGVGRAADVGWSNLRGGADALKTLLSPKVLPSNLRTADDDTVLSWDAQDDVGRRQAAVNIAEAAVADKNERPDFKDKAAEFLKRAADPEAWREFAPVVAARQKAAEASAGVDRFFAAAKGAYGDMKKNEELTEEDKIIFSHMQSLLDPDSDSARDQGRALKMYEYLRDSIIDGKKDLPIHALDGEFAGDVHSAAVSMRKMMQRAGMLSDDPKYADTLKGVMAGGLKQDLTRAKIIGDHLGLQYGELNLSERRQLADDIVYASEKYDSMPKEWQAKFDGKMDEFFGKNRARVEEMLTGREPRPAENTDPEAGVSDADRTVFETPVAGRFRGSGADKGDNMHGGFFNLGHKDPEVRKSIRENYNKAKREMRAEGGELSMLTPHQYAEMTGTPLKDIAASLKVTPEELQGHRARILHSTDGPIGLVKDEVGITTPHIMRMAKATVKSLSHSPGAAVAQKVAQALGEKDWKKKRDALEVLGFPNAHAVEAGQYVKEILNHGNAGRFTVVMKGGQKYVLSAQDLIKQMRERDNVDVKANRPEGAAEMLRHFSMGVSGLLSNPDVASIEVHNKGSALEESRVQAEQKRKAGGAEVTPAKFKPRVLHATTDKAVHAADAKNNSAGMIDHVKRLEKIIEESKGLTGDALEAKRKEYKAARLVSNKELGAYGVFGKNFSLGSLAGTNVTLGQATRKQVRGAAHADKQTEFDSLQEKIDHLYERMEDSEDPSEIDKLASEAEELEAQLADEEFDYARAIEDIDSVDYTAEAGKGETTQMAEAAEARADRGVRTHQEETGAALHPRDKPKPASTGTMKPVEGGGTTFVQPKMGDIEVSGIKMQVPSNVSARDFTVGMRGFLNDLKAVVAALPQAANHMQRFADRVATLAAKSHLDAAEKGDLMAPIHSSFVEAMRNTMAKIAEHAKSMPDSPRKGDLRTKYAALQKLAAKYAAKADTTVKHNSQALDSITEAKEFEGAVDEVSAFRASIKKSGEHLKNAYNALHDAWLYGGVDKEKLIGELRAAAKDFEAAAKELALDILKQTKQLIEKVEAALAAAPVPPKEHGKRTTDEALELAADKFFAKVKPSVIYRPGGAFAKRRKAAAAEVAALLDSPTETLDRGDEALGPVDGYHTRAMFVEGTGEFIQFSIPKEISEVMGEHPDLGDLFDASVVTLSYTLSDGDLAVLGPIPGSNIERALVEYLSNTGEEMAWNRVEGVTQAQLGGLLGELHARLQKFTSSEHIGYSWERRTGATLANGRLVEAHAAYFNSQTSGQATGRKAPTPNKTLKTAADVKAYIDKVLGPKAVAELVKALKDPVTGKRVGGSGMWYRENGAAMIKIAASATDPMSVAHHEAMHEFFQRLMENEKDMAQILRQASDSPAVQRQIEKFFANEPNKAAIMSAMKADEHERVAYMFQVWAAGKLDIGYKTKSIFQMIKTFFKNMLGVLSNEQEAEAIMANFHNGKTPGLNEVAKALMNDRKEVADLRKNAEVQSNALLGKLKGLTFTADGILRGADNPMLEGIAKDFWNKPGDTGKIGLFSARTQKEEQMLNNFVGIIDGLSKAQTEEVLKGLQTPGFALSADPVVLKAQQRLAVGPNSFFGRMHAYLSAAGVPVGKLADYFPRAWDSSAIANNKKEFVDLLRKDFHAKYGKELGLAEAGAIATELINNHGAEAITETESSIGYTPYMQSMNHRRLTFLTSPEAEKFQRKDLVDIVSTYVGHAVHRAEYARRFDNDGSGLSTRVMAATEHEAEKLGGSAKQAWVEAVKTVNEDFAKRMDAYKDVMKNGTDVQKKNAIRPTKPVTNDYYKAADAIQAGIGDKLRSTMHEANKAIRALEGTLGWNANERWKNIQSNIMVYENVRLLWLSLFSQVIDPLGVIVRGGTMEDAFNTFKRGAAGTMHGWRGTHPTDDMAKLAARLGITSTNAILSQMGNAYNSLYMGKGAKRLNDRLFRINGVEAFTQGTRIGAMESGIGFILRHRDLSHKDSRRYMQELFGENYQPSDITLVNGELDYSDQKIQDALTKYVDSAMVRPNASIRPSWSSDPHYALFFHMKQFTYAFHKVILDRVINEVAHGNYSPTFALILAYVPMMIASDFLRGMLKNGGEPPEWQKHWKLKDYVESGVERAGLYGIGQIGLDAAKWGPAELAGPAAEQVTKASTGMYRAVRKDMALDARAEATGRPEDVAKAEAYVGWKKAGERTLRDAFPLASAVETKMAAAIE